MESRVQLIIQDVDGNRTLVDLYGEDTISLSYEFSAIDTLASQGEYSKEFTVPATDNNCKVFGYQHLSAHYSINGAAVNIRKKMIAYIAVNTIPLLEGYIQFKSATINNGQLSDFSIVFYGSNASLMATLGDLELKDLDYSALGVVMNLSNMYEHNTGVYGNKVIWSLIDKGQAFRRLGYDGIGKIVDYPLNEWIGTTSGAIMGNTVLTPQDLTPLVSVKYIIDLINAQLLYNKKQITLSGAISSHLNSVYIPYSVAKDTLKGVGQSISFGASAGSFTASWSAGDGGYFATIPTMTESIDTQNAFDEFGHRYTIQTSGLYLFSFQLYIESNNGTSLLPPAWDIVPRIKVWSPTTSTTTYYTAITSANAGYYAYLSTTDSQKSISIFTSEISPFIYGGNAVNASEGIYLNVDDQVSIEIFAENDPTSNGSIQDISNVSFTMNKQQIFGQSINLSANAPQYKITDFIRDLMMMHNAVLVPDHSSFDTIDMISMNEYLSTGEIDDWSDKLSVEDSIVITPSSEYQLRRQKFSWGKGSDVASQAYDKIGRSFGYLELYDSQSDFTQGERAISMTASSTPDQLIFGDDTWPIPKFIDDQYNYVAPGPRLVYVNTDNEHQISIRDSDPDTAFWSVYMGIFKQYFPVFHVGNYMDGIPNIYTNDLNFGQEIPLHPISATPFNTLFFRYYDSYLSEIYSQESKVMEASFMLNLSDIVNLKFNKSIFIKDSYWRILSVSDYTLGENQVTRCKLIRKLDSINIPASCQLTASGVTGMGTIIWHDQDGNVVTGNAICCNKLGFFWDADNSACRVSVNTPMLTGGGKPISHVAVDGVVNTLSNTTLIKDPAAVHALLAGTDIKVLKGASNSAAFGENIDVYKSGIWYGGGADTLNNRAGWGVMVYKVNGSFASATSRIDFDAFLIPPSSAFTAKVTVTGTIMSGGMPTNVWTFMGHGVYASDSSGTLSLQDPLDQILSTCDAGGTWSVGFDGGTNPGEVLLFVQSISGLTYPTSEYYFTATIEVNQIGTI